MKRFISNNKTAYILGILLLILLWQFIALLIGERTMVFPGPFETFKYTLSLLNKSYTYRCIFASLGKMFMGYIIALILAFIFGVIAGNNTYLEKVFAPTMTALRSIPTASLVYLFIVLAGFKLAPMYLVLLMSFPIIYEGVKEGIKNISPDIIGATKLDGASYLKDNIRVKIPLAKPYFLASMVSSFSLSFKIQIMAEVITGASTPGIGSAILGARSSDPTNMIPVFSYSLIAIVIMLIIDLLSQVFRKKYLSD